MQRRSLRLAVDQLDAAKYLPFGAPRNEQETIYVFALCARRLGFHVQSLRKGFPDCLAKRGDRKIRIEFEHRSRSFETHGHDRRRCDLIVCWKHDWPAPPIDVLPLSKLFAEHRADVFIVAYRDDFWSKLPDDRDPTGLWSVPSTAGPNDLLLIYRPATGKEVGEITDVYRMHTPVEYVKSPGWRDEPDWMAEIQRVHG